MNNNRIVGGVGFVRDDLVLSTDLTDWVDHLTHGATVSVETCRPGQEVYITHSWDGGAWGRGAVTATEQAIFPGNWEPAATGRYESVGSNEAQWAQPPVSEPTLYRVVDISRTAGNDEQRTHVTHRDERFVLYIPTGETEEQFRSRERRAFAARQRERLVSLGLTTQQIRAVFDAAGVGSAVEAAQLAQDAKRACKRLSLAHAVISDVAHAPYGRARRISHLAEFDIDAAGYSSAARLNRALAGALTLLQMEIGEAAAPKESDDRPATIADLAAAFRVGRA